MKIAIVTGASSGIGREYVRQIAEREALDEIWVVARREERLEELKSAIKTKIVPICVDLCEPRGYEKIRNMLADISPDVRVLVNAAGYGKFGAFNDIELSEQLGMVELNINALTKITFHTLPYMSEGAKIFFVGSRSGFHPVPYISVYAATKSYVLSFSRAIGKELEKRKISTIAVCPGWVRTEFFDRAVENEGVIVYYNNFVTPEQVVSRSYRDIARGKDVSVCGASTRFQVFIAKLLPHKLVMKIWCKQQKK